MKEDKGFTLIELLTVISIIVIMLTIVLLNSATLNNRVRVEAAVNQVFDIIKETRHNSVSVREFKNNLFPSYGLYFDISFPGEVIVYADCVIDDNDDSYINDQDNFVYDELSTDCGAEGDLVKRVILNHRVKIGEIRSIPSVGDSAGSINIEPKVYLEYLRPEPTVWITLDDGSLLPAGKVEIDIVDINNKFKKTIIFWSTGQFVINS